MPKNPTQSNKPKTPKLRFPGFDGVWEEKKLEEVCEYKNGGAFENYIDEKGKYLLITLNSIDINGNLKEQHKKVAEADWYLEKNDLIMVLSDVAHGNFLGLVDIIPENQKYVLNQRMGLLRKKDDSIDLNFLRKYINKRQKYFKLHGQGSSQQNLSKEDILKFKIPTPELPEQQKIASFLGGVNTWIENLREQKKSLESYKKGLMQKIFSQQIRFKDEKGNDFPDWEEKRLEDVVDIKTGKKDVNQGNPNGKYPFFTCAREHTYSDEYSFEGEAIMIAGNGEVGLCTYYNGKFEAYQRTYVLQDFKISASYLFIYLKSAFQNFAESQKQQGSMPYIKLSTLKDFIVPIQLGKEQQKIAEFLSSVDTLLESKQQQITKAEEWRKGLMQGLFV